MTIGVAGFLSVAACHKVAPLAATPNAPVAPATNASNPATTTPSRSVSASNAASNQPSQASRAAGMTPEDRATLNQRLARLEDALFDYDKATIRADATTALKDDVNVIRGILSTYPGQRLLIEGGADERGSEEFNLALGDKRARAAEEFLTTMGVPATQLAILSLGKDHPVCTESTENCWQRNRRAHVTAAP